MSRSKVPCHDLGVKITLHRVLCFAEEGQHSVHERGPDTRPETCVRAAAGAQQAEADQQDAAQEAGCGEYACARICAHLFCDCADQIFCNLRGGGGREVLPVLTVRFRTCGTSHVLRCCVRPSLGKCFLFVL